MFAFPFRWTKRAFTILHLLTCCATTRAGQRPAVFTAILLVCAGICLSQIGKREGAGLLTAVLAIVAIGLPAVYFGTFFANLSKQIKKLGLPRPFYRLELDAAGLSVWMAGEQNKTEPTNRYTWNTVYCAYRTKEAVYIYVQKNQAYLLNESMDAAWSLLAAPCPLPACTTAGNKGTRTIFPCAPLCSAHE